MRPYSRGGATSKDNGTLACGSHHRQAHAEGWTAELINGRVRWRRDHTNHTNDPDHNGYNDHLRQIEHAIRDLALRWLARNPHLRNDPDHPPDPAP